MRLGLGIGLTLPRYSRSAVVVGPVNNPADPPRIEGPLNENATLNFFMGDWPTATSFDIAVIDNSNNSVLLARQAVAGNTNGTVSGTLGKTIKLRVWGKNAADPAGTNFADSAPFGPIVAAGDELILAVILSSSGTNGAVQNINGIPFITVTGTYLDNLYNGVDRAIPGFPGLFYGFTGGAVSASAIASVGGTNPTDPRFRGRWGISSTAGSMRFRCDLPQAGVYRVYTGHTVGSSALPYNLGIFENANATSGVGTIVTGGGFNGAALTNAGSLRDATGAPFDTADRNINVTNWAAESGPGGNPAEVTMSTTAMALARHPSASGAPHLNVFAIYRKTT